MEMNSELAYETVIDSEPCRSTCSQKRLSHRPWHDNLNLPIRLRPAVNDLMDYNCMYLRPPLALQFTLAPASTVYQSRFAGISRIPAAPIDEDAQHQLTFHTYLVPYGLPQNRSLGCSIKSKKCFKNIIDWKFADYVCFLFS